MKCDRIRPVMEKTTVRDAAVFEVRQDRLGYILFWCMDKGDTVHPTRVSNPAMGLWIRNLWQSFKTAIFRITLNDSRGVVDFQISRIPKNKEKNR